MFSVDEYVEEYACELMDECTNRIVNVEYDQISGSRLPWPRVSAAFPLHSTMLADAC
jgi:hypothetical protein